VDHITKYKEIKMFRACHITSILLLLTASLPGAELKEIHLGGFNYPPFYTKKNEVACGVGVELAHELFKRMNIKPSVLIYPMSRLLYKMKSGQTDGALFLLKTSERSKYLRYSIPIMTIPGQLWSAAGRQGGAIELKDIGKYRVGVTQGYSYGEKFDSLLKKLNTASAYSDYANYKLLLAGKIDVFPGNELVAKSLFKTHRELNKKFIHGKSSFVNWEFHMVVSKKSPLIKLLPEINKHIADLRNEGVIDAIVSKYIN